MNLEAGDVVRNSHGQLYELLQDAYVDETLNGGECFRAMAKDVETEESVRLEWPIKNDHYNSGKFFVSDF